MIKASRTGVCYPPSAPWYEHVTAEQLFNTVEEAEEAGYRVWQPGLDD